MPDIQTFDRLFLDGQWVEPATDGRVEVVSASTELVIARVAVADTADVDRAVSAARTAFDHGPWPIMTPAARSEAIGRLVAAIGARSSELTDAITNEVGAPHAWATMGQVGIASAVFGLYASLATTYPFSSDRVGLMRNPVTVNRLPVGVVAAIVPWNAPLFIAALKLGPALAAGCTVVLKPALEAALDASLLAEAIAEAGLPPGVVNVIPAGAAASEYLVSHAGVDKVSFTGSTAVGRRIGELCGRDVRRCTLELGGKSAAIILDDLVLDDRTVRALVDAGMANNGQVCAAQTRVLVPRSREREVVDALAGSIRALKVGDPFEDGTEVGPLATARQRDRVLSFVESGVREGARTVVGGGRPSGLDRGWYVTPTLFADVENAMTIAREEIFGPVMSVIGYDDDADAVALANDSEYGLTATVWTADVERGAAVAATVRAGTVAINSGAAMDLNAPFGGFKRSGIGRECGPEAIDAYTELQSVIRPRVKKPSA